MNYSAVALAHIFVMYDVQNGQPHEFILAGLRNIHMIISANLFSYMDLHQASGKKTELIFVHFFLVC